MLRVLTLSTLFPDVTRPNFGVFVERQTLGLAAHPDVDLRLVAPIGLAPWPLSRHPRYRQFASFPAQESWKGLNTARPRFINLPATQGRFHARSLVRRLIPLLTVMRETFPFDVIDAQFFFPDGPAAIALGQHFGVPVSIKARGADIHLWGHGPTGDEVRMAGIGADGLLAVSAAMRDDMVALGMAADQISVHYTGVDLDRFVPVDRAAAKAALGLSGPVILSLGALVKRKGHAIIARALADLPRATLLVVGEGDDRAALEREIAATGLGDRVRLLGAVDHATLQRLIPAADVMALASASEGLANAWVEALACGVPIVIPDIGGAREVVTDRVFGRIVERNAPAFAAGIADLLTNPPAPDEVRAGAARFTWAANTAALYDHLSGLIERRRAFQ